MCESNSLAYTQTSGGSGGGHHHHHHHNHHHHHHHPQVEHCVSIVDRNHNQTEHHPFYEHQQEQQKTATTFNTNNNNHETSLFSTNATIANSNSNSGNYYCQENGTNCNGVRTTTTNNNNNDNSSGGGGGGGCDNDDDNGGVCENDGRNQASTSKDEEEKNEDDEGRNHGSRFENAFQMRTINLTNFPNNSASSQRTSYRTVLNRARIGITTSTAKSLNILRQALQNRINAEINEILQKYLENYFQPAADNIRNNLGVNAISEQHLQQVCRQALEEAKNMYFGPLIGRSSCPASPAAGVGSTTTGGHQQLGIGVGVRETLGNPDQTNNNNSSCSSHLNNSQHHHNPSDSENTFGGHHHHSTVHHKRKRRERRDSNDSTEDYGYNHGSALLKPINKKKRLKAVLGRGTSSGRGGGGHAVKNHTKVTDQIRRDGPRWDPNRLTTETKFVLGSKANKALGFGSTRGRLYTKHAGLFRYIGDAEDKQWLHEHGLMPLAGGRAYLLIKEDIENLIDSDEYRNAPGVNRNDMGDGFAVPESMIFKMKAIMAQMKTPEIVVTIKKDESDHSNVIIKNQFCNKDSTLTTATTNLNCNTANSHSMYEASSVGSNSNQLSVDTLRPPAQEDTSGAPSPADDLDCLNSTGLPSTNPSPFSGVGLSPANQEEVDEVSQSCLMDAEEQLRTSNGTSMNKIQI